MIYINIPYRKKHDPIGLCFHNNRQPPVIFLLLDKLYDEKTEKSSSAWILRFFVFRGTK